MIGRYTNDRFTIKSTNYRYTIFELVKRKLLDIKSEEIYIVKIDKEYVLPYEKFEWKITEEDITKNFDSGYWIKL